MALLIEITNKLPLLAGFVNAYPVKEYKASLFSNKTDGTDTIFYIGRNAEYNQQCPVRIFHKAIVELVWHRRPIFLKMKWLIY